MKTNICFILCFFNLLLPYGSIAQLSSKVDDAYTVENIIMPEGLTSETGAIDFLPDGRLIACFTRGEVMTYEPKSKRWKLFAEGLHDPLGMLVISNTEVLVMQRPELTRIKDTNGDGVADVYENVTDDFGISGNYHEFNYGPVKDKNGNLFIALNASSPAGKIRKEVRGKLDTLGRDGSGNSQMFSMVPYRGWIMKLTPAGKLLPFATGFRSPNGLGFDLDGNLFASENQGDWIGTSSLHHVTEGKFYGHPASLVWKKDWMLGSPFQLPVKMLDSMRTRAAVLFPHGVIANSPTQPLVDNTKGKFGPFQGQFFIGEMNEGRIVRVMIEKVQGEFQGACIPFLDRHGLRKGNNRLAFAPDGSLWVGQNAHGWLGDEGIQRIVFNNKKRFDIYTMNLTQKGFEISFTEPVDYGSATDSANFRFRRYYYAYHKEYGSDQFDNKPVGITAITVSPDRRKVTIDLSELKAGYVYELKLGNVSCAEGQPLFNKIICYTLNKLLPNQESR
jgi:hypothetical protein